MNDPKPEDSQKTADRPAGADAGAVHLRVDCAVRRHRFHLPVEISALLRTLDTIICFVFLEIFSTAFTGRKAGWRF